MKGALCYRVRFACWFRPYLVAVGLFAMLTGRPVNTDAVARVVKRAVRLELVRELRA